MTDFHRYKITIEYDGTFFSGWQKQMEQISVAQVIEDAIYSMTKEKVRVYGSGRTDSGVHALGQVAHFDLAKYYNPHNILGALNHYVKPHAVAILDCTEVNSEFHARFSTSKRHYLYRIKIREAPVILDKNRVWHIKSQLDLDAMKLGASYLIGSHDFTSFRASICQAKSPIKSLDNIDIFQVHDEVHFIVSAKSFLHHMVRNIVGTLKLIGSHKLQPQDIPKIIEAKNRSAAGPTAPAQGLYLLKINY